MRFAIADALTGTIGALTVEGAVEVCYSCQCIASSSIAKV